MEKYIIYEQNQIMSKCSSERIVKEHLNKIMPSHYEVEFIQESKYSYLNINFV